jgi:hypothetical protein
MSAAFGVLIGELKVRSLGEQSSAGQLKNSTVSAANSPLAIATPTPSVSSNITSQMQNSLEVSGASRDFEGTWGGYMSGMVYSVWHYRWPG